MTVVKAAVSVMCLKRCCKNIGMCLKSVWRLRDPDIWLPMWLMCDVMICESKEDPAVKWKMPVSTLGLVPGMSRVLLWDTKAGLWWSSHLCSHSLSVLLPFSVPRLPDQHRTFLLSETPHPTLSWPNCSTPVHFASSFALQLLLYSYTGHRWSFWGFINWDSFLAIFFFIGLDYLCCCILSKSRSTLWSVSVINMLVFFSGSPNQSCGSNSSHLIDI